MTDRATLPNRRLAERISFEHDGQPFALTLGFYGEWRDGAYRTDFIPGETFIAGGRVGSSLEAMCRDIAVIISIAIQHDVPLDTMRKAITRLDDGAPAGPGGKLLDLIAERNGE